MICLGVDPGLLGAVAWWQDGKITRVEMMPLVKDYAGKLGPDVYQLRTWFSHPAIALIACEKQAARPTDGKKGIFTLGRGYGRLEAALLLANVPRIFPDPKVWKAEILKGTKKDKAAAIGYVQSKYPGLDLYLPNGKDLSDGKAEAVCLAEYAARQVNSQLEPKGPPCP